jgi:hypothetical protein
MLLFLKINRTNNYLKRLFNLNFQGELDIERVDRVLEQKGLKCEAIDNARTIIEKK